MQRVGLEWTLYDTHENFLSITTPQTPPASQLKVYSKQVGGVSTLCILNDAGTELCFPTSGAVGNVQGGGTGIQHRVAIWQNSNTIGVNAALTSGRVVYPDANGELTGDSLLNWDPTNHRLYVGQAVNTNATRALWATNLAVGGSANSSSILDFNAGATCTISTNFVDGGGTNPKLHIFCSGVANQLFLDTNGKVGIGNQAPGETLDVTGTFKLSSTTSFIDIASITAGNVNFKVTATSATPAVTWAGGGNAPNAAPSGYLQILVGANTRYIPFWA